MQVGSYHVTVIQSHFNDDLRLFSSRRQQTLAVKVSGEVVSVRVIFEFNYNLSWVAATESTETQSRPCRLQIKHISRGLNYGTNDAC